jgi:hypothetical protein
MTKTIEGFKKEDISGKHLKFIELQNFCPLCNCQLDIQIFSGPADYMIREEALCPQCEVMARIKDHKIH